MSQIADLTFPSLFRHSKRAEWGVAVLSAQLDGKRSYLFEDGEERTLGFAGIDLLRVVERPDRDEQATCAHLMSLLAKRTRSAPADAGAAGVALQLERFLQRYPGGFIGAAWQNEKREGLARRASSATSAMRTRLSSRSLESLLERRAFATVWQEALKISAESGLATDLKLKPAASEQHLLAHALRDLLHGEQSYEFRFDGWVSAYQAVFGESPNWQTATLLPALMSPVDNVFVDLSSFRKQLAILKRPAPLGARPSGAAYARCLSAARSLAHLLAASGEVPRDLLDVHDFIRCSS